MGTESKFGRNPAIIVYALAAMGIAILLFAFVVPHTRLSETLTVPDGCWALDTREEGSVLLSCRKGFKVLVTEKNLAHQGKAVLITLPIDYRK